MGTPLFHIFLFEDLPLTFQFDKRHSSQHGIQEHRH